MRHWGKALTGALVTVLLFWWVLRDESLRDIFTKSLVAQVPLVTGTVLTEAHLAMKKPGTGIPAGRLSSVVGRRLKRPLEPDEQLRADDLE